ncbi:MAG: tetratricopeptide repeat protein [Lachnospiraceae bacterium]|nr:tetratricopeptide repeat protein [Lachnospiraceae bacterium]
MKCFHCGNRLGKGDLCLTCGQDVRLFKKILAASWRYYDEGLKKAQSRDLTGAIVDLKNSLLLYKGNTEARNLLGLIYYEMGDMAQALIEWVISDNLNPNDDHAAKLLSKIQSDQVELERGTLMIRKYNQALRYAQGGSEDLAILQLNKVLSVSPHMVSANLLMALLQMHAGQNERAEKYIRHVLKVDRCNAMALHYKELLKTKDVRKSAVKEKDFVSKEAEIRRQLSGNDVIIPTYKENHFGFHTILEVAAGIALGAALVAYLVMPSRISSLKSDFDQTLISYNERLSAKEAVIAAGEDEIQILSDRIAKLESQVQNADVQMASVIGEYDKLLQAQDALRVNEYLQSARIYLTVDASVVTDEVFRQIYGQLQEEFDDNGYKSLFPAGLDLYNRRKYESASEYFKVCTDLDPDSIEAKYYLAVCYVRRDANEAARPLLEEIINTDPDGAFTESARKFLSNITE